MQVEGVAIVVQRCTHGCLTGQCCIGALPLLQAARGARLAAIRQHGPRCYTGSSSYSNRCLIRVRGRQEFGTQLVMPSSGRVQWQVLASGTSSMQLWQAPPAIWQVRLVLVMAVTANYAWALIAGRAEVAGTSFGHPQECLSLAHTRCCARACSRGLCMAVLQVGRG